ncbi:phage tail length tape measure family protein [Sinorhizobium meliloti]|uniref:phage tail length tape measure family protein n=1 Tax=Rhizobium meliloti TaxID=382 RepID=UPI002380AD8F|nr:phage tail length tape measure family protein [Sinorhizobium meliloti]MDE3796989.1 phage tail length tape measure family protein [Sinorhizobium meliloti]
MAANDDTARLLVSIEATQAKFEKQLSAVAKAAERAARNTESAFQGANDNVGKSFEGAGRRVERSMGSQRAAVSNLSAQLNDITMQLASGTSPFTVMVQQGSQVSQALQGSGGLVGAVKTLGGAFAQMVNPVSLASFALIGLAGYAVQYFTSVGDGAEESDKALKAHADLIAAVAKEWGDAVPALKSYAEAAKEAQNISQLREATDLHIDDIFKQAREQVKGLSIDITAVVADLRAAGAEEESILKIQDAFNAVKTAIDSGKDSTKETQALTAALINEWLNSGVTSAQAFAGQIHNIAQAFAEYAKQAEEARKQADAAIQARRVEEMQRNLPGNLGQLSPIFSGGGRFLNEAEAMNARAQERAADSAGKAADSFDGLNDAVGKYVNNVVKAESGGNANAKNPNSSATGVGQFIESTWLSLFKKHFPDRAQSMADSTILALRSDAEISRTLIEAYARENAGILRQAGVSVNEAALQLAHFLGPGGAVSVLTAKSGTPVSQVLGSDAIAANPSILGGGATVDDVIAYAQRRTQAVQGETAAVTQLNDAWAGLRAPTDAHTQAVNQQSQAYQDFGQIAQTAFQGLANALADGKLEGKELLQIVMQIVQQLFSMPSAGGGGGLFGGGGFGGILSGIFGSIFHKGGVAGGPAPQRMVSPSTFAGAKRYHTGGVAGLMPGEVPAILQRGEVVLPRGTKMGGAQQVHVTVGVSADNNGNLLPFVESVSQKTVSSAAPKIVSAANQQVVPTMAAHQKNKAGAEWR